MKPLKDKFNKPESIFDYIMIFNDEQILVFVTKYAVKSKYVSDYIKPKIIQRYLYKSFIGQ